MIEGEAMSFWDTPDGKRALEARAMDRKPLHEAMQGATEPRTENRAVRLLREWLSVGYYTTTPQQEKVWRETAEYLDALATPPPAADVEAVRLREDQMQAIVDAALPTGGTDGPLGWTEARIAERERFARELERILATPPPAAPAALTQADLAGVRLCGDCRINLNAEYARLSSPEASDS